MAPVAARNNTLAACGRVWTEIATEFDESKAKPTEAGSDAPVDDVKKVAKWIQGAVTKFGAIAAVADDSDRQGLIEVAEDCVKAFTAVAGTLLSLRRGAGVLLMRELRDAGAGLASALDGLGAAEGTPQMALSVGKVLDKVKVLERVATTNRAACRRLLLQALKQLRDAHREVKEALGKSGEEEEDLEEEDDFGGLEEELEPEERLVVEAVSGAAVALEEALKAASQSCAAPAEGGGVSLEALESAASGGFALVQTYDGLACHSLGGFDAKEFRKSLVQFRSGAGALHAAAGETQASALASSVSAMQAAADAIE